MCRWRRRGEEERKCECDDDDDEYRKENRNEHGTTSQVYRYPSYWGVLSLLFISTQIIYPHLPDQSVFSSPPINGLSSIPIFHKPLIVSCITK